MTLAGRADMPFYSMLDHLEKVIESENSPGELCDKNRINSLVLPDSHGVIARPLQRPWQSRLFVT